MHKEEEAYRQVDGEVDIACGKYLQETEGIAAMPRRSRETGGRYSNLGDKEKES